MFTKKQIHINKITGLQFTKQGTEYTGIKRSFRLFGYELWLVKIFSRIN